MGKTRNVAAAVVTFVVASFAFVGSALAGPADPVGDAATAVSSGVLDAFSTIVPLIVPVFVALIGLGLIIRLAKKSSKAG